MASYPTSQITVSLKKLALAEYIFILNSSTSTFAGRIIIQPKNFNARFMQNMDLMVQNTISVTLRLLKSLPLCVIAHQKNALI
jgi:hypothetical protein